MKVAEPVTWLLFIKTRHHKQQTSHNLILPTQRELVKLIWLQTKFLFPQFISFSLGLMFAF